MKKSEGTRRCDKEMKEYTVSQASHDKLKQYVR